MQALSPIFFIILGLNQSGFKSDFNRNRISKGAPSKEPLVSVLEEQISVACKANCVTQTEMSFVRSGSREGQLEKRDYIGMSPP
jgi:hypothetical protein